MTGELFTKLFLGALPVALAGVIEAFSITKVTVEKIGGQLDANQELIAIGMANMFGSFFQAFPLSGAFGRTAVNNAAGARTQVSGFIGAMVVMMTLLFLTPVFYYLPQAISFNNTYFLFT
jgi:SulP family sulfate permease